MSLQLSDSLKIKLKENAHKLKMTTSIPGWNNSNRTVVVTEFSSISLHLQVVCVTRIQSAHLLQSKKITPAPAFDNAMYSVQCFTISALIEKENKTNQNKQHLTPTIKQLHPTWQCVEHRSFLSFQDKNILQTGGKMQFSHQHRSVKSGLSTFLNIL